MIADILSRLKSSPDREHEMSLNRLIFLSLIAAYTFWINPSVPREALIAATIFAIVSIGIAVHIVLRPHHSTIRRIIAIVSDLATASVQLHYVGETSSVLFLLYLWITFGNGFRFGIRFLYIAVAVSVACFTMVIYTTPRWRDDIYLSATLLLSLIVLPLYASTLIRKLSNAKAQAEAANKAKTLFLASVSHELRTPLNAVIGLSSLMAGTNLDAEQRGIVHTIGSAGESLLRQINSLLSLSRIEAGKMPIERVDLDLLEVLSTARAMVITQAQQKGLRVTIHIAPQTPLQLHGPKHHLEEILLNLLGNAVKFTERGYVTLAAHPLIENGRRFVRFIASDTGIGIAPQALGRIFDSFTQADETIINRFGGTGLGLSICQQLIGAMGGRIGVDSREGHGSSFWFILPMEEASSRDAPSEQQPRPFRPLLVCADPTLAEGFAVRLGGGDDCPIARNLAEAKEWMLQARGEPVVPFCFSDLPAASLATEIEKVALPILPVLIRTNAPRRLVEPGLVHVSSSVLPLDFTVDEARTAMSVTAAQTSWAQSIWTETSRVELPVAAQPLSILVADDNATNRLVISKILERGGHAARCVENGEEALNLLEAERFDLVIMDINMPVMTGIEAANLFRFTEPPGTRIPIIALTADATPEIVAESRAAGMDACLTKPVQPAVLLKAIDEHAVLASAPGPVDTVPAATSQPDAHSSFIDESLLAELEQLGGREFVLNLVEEFFSDAERLIAELQSAAAAGDSHRFRLEAHGLQSASANVGARAVHEICVSWRRITSADLATSGAGQVERLARALKLTQEQLKQHLSPPKEAGAPAASATAAWPAP
ncbi:response regulator [Microvirga lotononidis]|uniref:histidine kinase n=1 Tax=Microvirga lotononidis TaxID=864069 RepID=I4YPI0_9HYPH|nr:response regulator [Microvirga lotononidis]EIM25872.1 signal transduction histidine kinase [Microvirga lotononidis]WQO25792.1 response regulator [Microvirga lotononidis]